MSTVKEKPGTRARTARLEGRVTPEVKAVIDRAASLQGVNTTDFPVAHSIAAARQTIRRFEGTVLRPEDRDAFMRAFEDATPNEGLTNLMALHKRVAARR